MNVLDLILIVAAVAFAVSGYRQGFIVGVLSFIGFLGGGVLGMWLVPFILKHFEPGLGPSIAAICVVLVLATLTQALATALGSRMRRHLTWTPAKVVDAAGGAVVSVSALLVVVWLIGSSIAGSTMPTVAREVRGSQVLGGVQKILPQGADTWFSSFSNLLDSNGFPQVFSPFVDEDIPQVPPPDPALLASAAVQSSRDSIVKIVGTAKSCGKVIEGSGFVYAPNRVMTNAHVVGGVRKPTVQIGGEGKQYDAEVVLYDWRRDIAVLAVPGLKAAPLQFEQKVQPGSDALVIGFPENGAFHVEPARVRAQIKAGGPDIYKRGTVSRDVYSLYAKVRQGNSGGPLISPSGKVYGVIFAKSLDDESTGYALTAEEIREDIEAGVRNTKAVDTQGCAL
ncbi:MarP family serine protease [Yinghuangia sp. ASG 101]|uniref:MarP family serine protease n=1 Tax=Yinghuangia sp. ASG 101 TaxID=2896848 RepID=UPI001E3E8B77|nr:MarP family serine protease [Yinghuangia sp. ASG 101]UGQ09090.1 MarP family serine protease [Yinghuangia sp. ASG 101]